MQVSDGFSRIIFHHVGDNNMTQIFSVFGNMQHRSDKFAIASINIKARHELVVADAHTRAVDFSLHATPAYLACVRHARLVDAGAIRLLYRHCDGMVGIRFGMSRQLKQAIAFDAFRGMNRDNAEGAARKRASFIKHNRIDRGKRLQIIAALDQNAKLARTADAAEKRKRNANDERTRTTYHEERQSAKNPIAQRAKAEQGRKQR